MRLVKLETWSLSAPPTPPCPIRGHGSLLYLLTISETHACCHAGLDYCSSLLSLSSLYSQPD